MEKKRTISTKAISADLSEKLQLEVGPKKVASPALLTKIDRFFKQAKSNKEKRKKTLESYLKSFWGREIPYLTLEELKESSKKFVSFRMKIEDIAKNCVLDEEGFVVFSK